MPDSSSYEYGDRYLPSSEKRLPNTKKTPVRNPSPMQRRVLSIPGTNRYVNPLVSTGAGLALVASGLGMTVDAAAEQFSSKDQNMGSGVIVEPVKSVQPQNQDMVARGAHPQKYMEQPQVLVDTRTKESSSQMRVGVIAEVFPNLPAGRFNDVNSELDRVYQQMERDGVFGDIKEIIARYDTYIDLASKKYNIPKDVLYGVFVTETSGNLDALHDSDAMGPGIMPAAAEELGIALSDRTRPEVAFDAMAKYLDKYRKIFGNDLGFGIVNYYAGPGNVSEMIRVDASGRNMKDPGSLEPANYGAYNAALKGRSVYETLNDSGVGSQVLRRLDSKTPEYPLRVAAGAENYRKALR